MSNPAKLLTLLLALLLLGTTGHAQTNLVLGGQSCAAITPNQARFLQWKETALFNRSGGKSFFVACPIIRSTSDEFMNAAVGVINDSAETKRVQCYFKEVSVAGEIVTAFPEIELVLEPGASDTAVLPSYRVKDLNHFFSVVCRLQPDTGVTVVIQTLNDG